ncbi:efflux RND transporter permease subunit [Deinococcus maricopensis]|uniref:Acriflavin resistance protein n=1 Tax=Deinococcus maricopensis (strain DSM 21211 / LMG 22137 / NRRL B-23946 / LB-34) TaxID=709986 RepID=E8U829_DEIML|nr:efflux RND transporter permease subunit [Deinococcus maricopensis]ADV67218.1 acriflavin resistance protein [Deinococcus maricopensis DSM 21211]
MTDEHRPPVTDAVRPEEAEVRINPAVGFSVRRYVFSIGVFLAVVLFGLLATTRLGVELLPSFEVPVVAVSTPYTGATPDQVDRDVSRQIEDAVSTLSGVSDISSTSTTGRSVVIITFTNDTDINSAANSVSQSVAAIRGALPSGSDAPIVQKFDPNAQPIITLALFGGAAPLRDVTTYANDTIKTRLERVNGVADVTVSGGPERQAQVLLDPARLSAYNLSPNRVSGAISASALDVPAGSLTQDGNQVGFSTRTTPTSLADIGNILLDPARGLRVRDVATIRDSTEPITQYARVNGQPAVLLGIRKGSGTNSVQVADNVRAAMRELNLPGGYQLIAASDETTVTRATVEDTFKEFLIGIFAVGVVVLLFLGRLNTVFAVILAIPISVSAAPLLYSLFGFTFNIISLLAIIVAIGIVVDDSIVVAENVQRYRDKGYSLMRSVLVGGSEVFSAVTAASFSLLAVLIPLSFMPGILGQFFRQFGLGLAAAIAFSWLESLLFLTVRMAYTSDPEPIDWRTYGARLRRLPDSFRWGLRAWRAPWGLVGLLVLAGALFAASRTAGPAVWAALLLYPLLLGLVRAVLIMLLGLLEAVTHTLHGATERVVSRIADVYARSVAAVLPRNLWVILGAVAFLLSGALAVSRVGFAFTPQSDSGLFSVDATLPSGTSLDATNALARRLEANLLNRDEVDLVSTTVNAGSASFTVTLKPRDERPNLFTLLPTYRRELQALAQNVNGANVTVGAEDVGPGGTSDISLALTAPTQALLETRNRDLLRLLGRDPNLASVKSSLSETRQERNFVPDAARLTGTGLTNDDLAQALRTYNNGTTAGTLRAADDSVDIVVKLDPALVSNEQSLLSQTVYAQQLSANIPLSQLGTFQLQQAPATLRRYNKAYTSTIDINLNPGAPGAFEYQKTVVKNARDAGLLQNGVTLGDSSSFGASGLTGDLLFYGPVVIVLAVLLTYLVLGSQFNSFRYPVYLILPVPLAIVGALWTLALFRTNLDVITVLGMVILLGLSTKNSILYLEFVVERLRVMPLYEALVDSARLRFRPILMTTLTVLVISVPLVFGHGEGAEFRRGLGIVILGGVITSTLLTFYVIPSVFYRFERKRQPILGGAPAPATD